MELTTVKLLLKRRVYRNLVTQVWVSAVLGLLICIAVGFFCVYAFFFILIRIFGFKQKSTGKPFFFSIAASVIISVIGIFMLRLNKMKEKWRYIIAKKKLSFETHKDEGRWEGETQPFLT